MFTPVTRRGGGWGEKEKAQAKPQTSQQLGGGSGRRGAASSWKERGRASPRRVGRWGQLALHRRVPRAARRKPSASGAVAGFPAPAAEEGRAQAGSPQARRASAVPAALSSAADRCPRPRRGAPAGGLGPLTLVPEARLGEQTVALTWLVRCGRDGHGSGARGGTSSPGKDRLFRRGAGESGRQDLRSPVSEAAPWTPTRSFSVAAGPPSHYPPPSSVAAASTSSSAETPRPLHTLSHHAAGEPLPPVRHFRPQVIRSRLGAGGAGGTGGGHSKGISVTVSLPRAGVVAQSAGRHFG